MKVNVNDLVPPSALLHVSPELMDPEVSDRLYAKDQLTAATELSLDDMRKYSGTGIYLLSAVVD